MEILKHYRDDPALRASFNRLAEATFGLNLENWYQNGFWGDNYDPYSVVVDGEVVANVSLNRTDMVIHGERKRLYQLGTVMTKPEYRNRGYIRTIMEEIQKDTLDADGVYLFGNDSVLDFYPKFGFTPGREHICTKSVSQSGPCTMVKIPMDGPEDWKNLQRAIACDNFLSACKMADNPGLIFFYVSQFMQDCVYYDENLDAWAIAELEDGNLFIHNVFSPEHISLDQVIGAFGGGVTQVTLGFTPADTGGYDMTVLKEEDCTFFTKGEAFHGFAAGKLRIPSMSHA